MDKNELIIPELNNETIESMIYVIRGQKVMLDFELAKIYGYETKNFNQQVKRNINKFNDSNMFKLNEFELKSILKSQIVISSFSSNWGGIRKLPYAFTVNGISILQTILKGDNVSFITNTLVDYLKDDSNLNKWLNEANNYEIVKFESGSISLDINVSPNEDTVWLTQTDLAILYNTSKQNISYHIQNIFNDKELNINSVVKENLTTGFDGKKYKVTYYNLDIVLSIGYRVNTNRGIEFRRWANTILKQYLLKGYSINTKRCLEHSDILYSLSNNVNNLKNQLDKNNEKLNNIENELKEVKSNFIDPNTYKHYLIKDGYKIEADIAYQSIYKLAKSSIYIIDDYIDIKTLQLLKSANKNINIIIISDNKGDNNLNKIFINEFINETKFNIKFLINNKMFHSRFIIIDFNTDNEIIYLCGGSSKDSGKRINAIQEIAEKELYKDLIIKVLNNKELNI